MSALWGFMTERQRGSGVSPGMETHLIALADEAETSLKRLLPRIEARVRSETDPTEWNALTLRSGPEVGIGGPYQSWIQESSLGPWIHRGHGFRTETISFCFPA